MRLRMLVLNRDESMMNELAPGVLRQRLVDSDLESDSPMGYVRIRPFYRIHTGMVPWI